MHIHQGRGMDVNAKIGIDSKRTTAASVAIVGVVVILRWFT